MKSLKLYSYDSEGVAAVEFALIAPALILILVGIFDFGTYMNSVFRLENTARAAAEYVVQGGEPEDIETYVIANSNLSADERQSAEVTTTYVCECQGGEVVDCDSGSCSAENDYVRRFLEVGVAMTYSPTFNWPGLPDSMDLGGAVRLQVAR